MSLLGGITPLTLKKSLDGAMLRHEILANNVANVNTPDGRTLIIQPWDKSMLQEIEKGIEVANLGFNPMNNGENIIINVPVLTEERRRELVKQAKIEVEEAKMGEASQEDDEEDEEDEEED